MLLGTAVRRNCPESYQARVTRAGGLNRYGRPNFMLAWSQSATERAGGVWPHDHYAGYREVYVANGSPYPPKKGYWMLMEWTPPEQYNGEANYFFLHRDETTGLCTLGPYPHRGRYVIAAKLIWTMMDNGKMDIEAWPLNSAVIDFIIPVVMEAKKCSISRRRAFAAAEKLRHERKIDSAVESLIHSSKRSLLPSQVEDRIRLMEPQWKKYLSTRQEADTRRAANLN